MTSSSDMSRGYKFLPYNQELLSWFLRRKICGEPLKKCPIRDVDLYTIHPYDLFQGVEINGVNGGEEKDTVQEIERYVFTPVREVSEKKGKGKGKKKMVRKAMEFGTWSGDYANEIKGHGDVVIGYDRYFKFAEKKKHERLIEDPNITLERKMHEFSFHPDFLPQGVIDNYRNLVVCRITMIIKTKGLKKRKSDQLIGEEFVQETPRKNQVTELVAQPPSKKQALDNGGHQIGEVTEENNASHNEVVAKPPCNNEAFNNYGGGGDIREVMVYGNALCNNAGDPIDETWSNLGDINFDDIWSNIDFSA